MTNPTNDNPPRMPLDAKRTAGGANVSAPATQWTDLIVRKALDDKGAVPYKGGTWTNSPDIIPSGTTAVGNPQAAFGSTSNYNSDQGQPTVAQQVNYFYVRAKNLGAAAQNGSVSLYYCPQNLFLFPSLWNKNQLKTSSGKTSVPLSFAKANDVTVVSEPFTYTPVSNVHSCLIAQVVTPTNPNQLPQDGTFGTMDELANYIVNHPNMAWRNVVLVDKNIPTFINTFEIDTTSLAAGTSGTFLIGLSYNNLAIGSQLAFSSGTPIPSGPDAGKLIQLTQTAVTMSSGSLGTSYITIPAGYKTTVSFSYFAGGKVQSGWGVRFYAILIVDPKNALLAKHAAPLHDMEVAGLDQSHPLLMLNEGGITKGIRVGDCSLIGQ
jgi:hypothetical protein